MFLIGMILGSAIGSTIGFAIAVLMVAAKGEE